MIESRHPILYNCHPMQYSFSISLHIQTVKEETPLPGIASSKFKEVVKKVMLDIRMKQLQQKYTKDLSEALEGLEQNYHSVRQEAFEKLVQL